MLPFSKYHGLGNDFLLFDCRHTASSEVAPIFTPALVQRLCDRRFGVGGDGVILALPPREGGEMRMRIYNADGSEPEMCGNGIRCLARFLADSDGDGTGRTWQVETLAGRVVPELRPDGTIRVDMGEPLLAPEAVPTTLPVGEAGLPQGTLEVAGTGFVAAAAGMGNPHVVIPVPDVEAVDLESLGPALEVHPAFPARVNVHFVQALSPCHLVMRVWERGAGPTLACGTGACATLVVCHRLGIAERRARLDLPGGSLEISWDATTNHLFMTGPAQPVFDGVLTPEFWQNSPSPSQAGGRQPSAPNPSAVAGPAAESNPQASAVNCAVACVNGCQRPDDCPSAASRARALELINTRSLDDLVALASHSLESRIRARQQREPGP